MRKGIAAEVAGWFGVTPDDDFPKDRQIIFAEYHSDGYDGNALVIYRRKRKLYEVHGSHCSCYGLEGQWEPEITTVKALLMRSYIDQFSAVYAALKKARLIPETE